MNEWRREPQPYPDDSDVRARMLVMPVYAPHARVRVRVPRPVRDCPECSKTSDGHACARHSYNPLASIGGSW